MVLLLLILSKTLQRGPFSLLVLLCRSVTRAEQASSSPTSIPALLPAARKARRALRAPRPPVLSPASPRRPRRDAAPAQPGPGRPSRSRLAVTAGPPAPPPLLLPLPGRAPRAQQRRAGPAARGGWSGSGSEGRPAARGVIPGRGRAVAPREPLTHILVEGVGGEKRHRGRGARGGRPSRQSGGERGRDSSPRQRRRRLLLPPRAAPPPPPRRAGRRLPRSTPGTGAGPAATAPPGPSSDSRPGPPPQTGILAPARPPRPRFIGFSYVELFRRPCSGDETVLCPDTFAFYGRYLELPYTLV